MNYTQCSPEQFAYEFYRNDAPVYLRYRTESGHHHEDAIVPILSRVLNNISNDGLHLIDIGCGFKNYAGSCTGFARYIGVDLSEPLLRSHSLVSCQKAQLIQGDVREFEFSKIHYDLVLGILMLNYVKEPSRILSKAKRKGAFFFFALPNPEYDRRRAIIDANGHVLHEINNITLKYYHHNVHAVSLALGNPEILNVEFSNSDPKRSQYVCFSGKW